MNDSDLHSSCKECSGYIILLSVKECNFSNQVLKTDKAFTIREYLPPTVYIDYQNCCIVYVHNRTSVVIRFMDCHFVHFNHVDCNLQEMFVSEDMQLLINGYQM